MSAGQAWRNHQNNLSGQTWSPLNQSEESKNHEVQKWWFKTLPCDNHLISVYAKIAVYIIFQYCPTKFSLEINGWA